MWLLFDVLLYSSGDVQIGYIDTESASVQSSQKVKFQKGNYLDAQGAIDYDYKEEGIQGSYLHTRAIS